jgi:LysM repeat protein
MPPSSLSIAVGRSDPRASKHKCLFSLTWYPPAWYPLLPLLEMLFEGGMMKLTRYRGRHLKRPPVRRGPAVVGTAAAMWMAGSQVAHAGVHVVRRGETLSGIASRYGTSVQQLAMTNNIADPNFIVAGQRLRVGGAGGSSGVATTSHTVGAGETLSSIASRYGTSTAALARLNRLKDPNLIIAGSTLRVPVGSPAGAPAAVAADIESVLEQGAAAYGVEPALVKAVAWQESGWQQKVKSKAGAVGVMQVMPATARFVNSVLGTGSLDVKSAGDNVKLGVRYLKHMVDTMPSEKKALAAYYAGPGAVGRSLSKEQRRYVKAVFAHRERFR